MPLSWTKKARENLEFSQEGSWVITPQGKTATKFVEGVIRPGSRGGIFVHDLNDDGKLDCIVSSNSHVGAYDYTGKKLWVSNIGIKTSGKYPGSHHPGVIAGDVDGDGKQEVAYLTENGHLRVLDGTTGIEKKIYSCPGAQVIAIANLRGFNDTDAILQYNQTTLRAIRLDANGHSCNDSSIHLWSTHAYIGAEHSPLRVADLDEDGRDEVAGVVFIDDDGTVMADINLGDKYHVDSIVIDDISPESGTKILEVVLAEQGGNNEVVVANHKQTIFRKYNRNNRCKYDKRILEPHELDCDKVAVGNFDPDKSGLEIFCRSACGRAPWVIDASGNIIADWVVDDTKPAGWHQGGVEEVVSIDWDGSGKHDILVKERHAKGDAAIVDPMTGKFKIVFRGSAARVYAVDLVGDAREEVIILNENGTIDVYTNLASSKGVSKVSPWLKPHYRRQKQNWNYYSP